MDLKPIVRENVDAAIAILRRGFDRHDEAFWRTAFARLRADSAAVSAPYGYIFEKDGRTIGAILTLRSVRTGADGISRPLVNLSSWFVDEAHRSYAPMMLRRVLKAAGRQATFTDLTATDSVAQMLPKLSFRPLSEGVLLTSLWHARRRWRSDIECVPFRQLGHREIPAAERKLLEDHARLGCTVLAVRSAGRVQPLVFMRRWRKGIPHAYLIYARDRAFALSCLANVCAHLLKCGQVLVAIDCNADEAADAGHFRPSPTLKYTHGPADGRSIDYAYSEFVYLGVS